MGRKGDFAMRDVTSRPLSHARTEKLFSYGTLQLTPVQIGTFQRELDGTADVLAGWEQNWIEITDADVLRKSGETFHPVLRHTGEPHHFVPGIVYQISKAELRHADDYESDAYERVSVTLKSGTKAWAYVGKRP